MLCATNDKADSRRCYHPGELLQAKFDRFVSREKRELVLLRFAAIVEIVEIIQTVSASPDGKDDKFLEVAVNGRASTLVSGDKDLLVLNPFRGIQIVTPAMYLAL